jgi:hypothetical protein
VPSYKATVGDGTTASIAVSHNLNSTDVMVTVVDLATKQITYPTVAITSANVVTVTFATAPAANSKRVIVGSF